MKLKTIVLMLLLLAVLGCTSSNLRFEGNTVIQTSGSDEEVSYGVISDIHGEVEKARMAAQFLKEHNVAGIIVPGDISCNERLSNHCPQKIPDQEEIELTLAALAETKLPIFVIPGNHEEKPIYEKAMANVTARYPNVIDMTKYRLFDGKVVDFLALPGYGIKTTPYTYQDPQRPQDVITTNLILIPKDGFYITPDKFREAQALKNMTNSPVLLITHGPGSIDGPRNAGTAFGNKDVGDRRVTQLMNNNQIPFAVVGHIHEAGGIATTLNGTGISSGEWASQMMLNAGTLQTWRYHDGTVREGMVQILTFSGERAKFETLTLSPEED